MTITIGDEVYERLLKIKRDDESFNDLLMRLIREDTLRLLELLKGSVDLPEADELLGEMIGKRTERRSNTPLQDPQESNI